MASVNDVMNEGRQAHALKMILDQEVGTLLKAGTAAALTVAYAILKTDRLSRGEKSTDAQLKEEVQAIYWEMHRLTDAKVDLAMRAQVKR
jgi:hypothetical protein